MTIPTLTPRAAREQAVFRTLFNAMARPGSVARLDLAGANPLVAIAEALVDHEVAFAVLPEQPELSDAILRQTGSHLAPSAAAEYVFCTVDSLALALSQAADGTPAYPDAGATLVCLVPAISQAPGQGDRIVVAGPGVRDTATVYVEGFGSEARRVFRERNASRPLGLDLTLVSPDGALVCFTRYTSFREGQEE